MELEALKKAIYELNDHRVKLKTIESDLHMPKNSLSGMLNGTRPFPKKWIKKLEAFVETHRPSAPVVEKPAPKTTLPIFQQPVLPEAEIYAIAERAKKSPPPGLTKTQKIRWHRENTQTLQ